MEQVGNSTLAGLVAEEDFLDRDPIAVECLRLLYARVVGGLVFGAEVVVLEVVDRQRADIVVVVVVVERRLLEAEAPASACLSLVPLSWAVFQLLQVETR